MTQPREVWASASVVVQRERVTGLLLRASHSLVDRRGAVVELQRVGIGQPGIGQGVFRILGDGLLEELDRLGDALGGALVPAEPSLAGRGCRPSDCRYTAAGPALAISPRKLASQGIHDGPRDLVLDGEHVARLPGRSAPTRAVSPSFTLVSCAVIRSRVPAFRTVPSSTAETLSIAPMVRTSSRRPLNANTEVRDATTRPSTLASALISSSVIPSLKYSFSGSALALTKGRTAIDRARGRRGRGRSGQTGQWGDQALRRIPRRRRTVGRILGQRRGAAPAPRPPGPPREAGAPAVAAPPSDAPWWRGGRCPAKGGCPASISWSTQARAYWSLRPSSLPVSARLFRAHVGRRADREPRLGDDVGARLEIARGDAEVGHERFALMEQDVLRLDVAVQDALAVGVVRAPAPPRERCEGPDLPADESRETAGRAAIRHR